MFIELPTLAAAQALVRLNKSKKLHGRSVSVVLASQTELLESASLLPTDLGLGRGTTVDRRPFAPRSSPLGTLGSKAWTRASLSTKASSSRLETSKASSRSALSR